VTHLLLLFPKGATGLMESPKLFAFLSSSFISFDRLPTTNHSPEAPSSRFRLRYEVNGTAYLQGYWHGPLSD
jgi:hypothetical protein